MSQPASIEKILLKINAIALNLEVPYIYTSGVRSPIYCDNRLIDSNPEAREAIISAFLNKIESQGLAFDVVACVATAGISHAALIAYKLNKPIPVWHLHISQIVLIQNHSNIHDLAQIQHISRDSIDFIR